MPQKKNAKTLFYFIHKDKLQFDSARFIFLLQLSGGGGGNTFRRCTE
jgi:hypothetical protein